MEFLILDFEGHSNKQSNVYYFRQWVLSICFFKGNLWVYGQDEKEATQNANRILKPLESANICVVRVSYREKRGLTIS